MKSCLRSHGARKMEPRRRRFALFVALTVAVLFYFHPALISLPLPIHSQSNSPSEHIVTAPANATLGVSDPPLPLSLFPPLSTSSNHSAVRRHSRCIPQHLPTPHSPPRRSKHDKSHNNNPRPTVLDIEKSDRLPRWILVAHLARQRAGLAGPLERSALVPELGTRDGTDLGG